MNKEKLVDVIEQVLTPVDEALDEELRKHLERTICNEVSQLLFKITDLQWLANWLMRLLSRCLTIASTG